MGLSQSYLYSDIANSVGIDHTYLLNNSGGGSSFYDFDMDGNDDITLATGEGEPIHFYRNTGNEFEKIDLGITNVAQAKSVIWVDYDNDGDLDLVVNNINEPAFIYENQNQQISNDNYLTVKLKGSSKNPFGIGTKVTFYNYDHLQYQEFYPTRGWQSSVDYRLHFGLGKNDSID